MNSMQLVSIALAVAGCALAYPGRAQKLPAGSVVVFEKPLRDGEKMVVTRRETLEVVQSEDTPPTRLYEYTFATISSTGRRTVVWTMKSVWPMQAVSFRPLKQDKTKEPEGGVKLLDVVWRSPTLYVLTLSPPGRPDVMIVRPDRKRGPHEMQWDSKDRIEKSGPFDGVADGRIVGPNLRGEVMIQLSHVRKLPDSSSRITTYHLATDEEGKPVWRPDPANQYADGEGPWTEFEPKHKP
jgi:hypothetical protein